MRQKSTNFKDSVNPAEKFDMNSPAHLIMILLVSVLPSFVFGSSGITYHGRILKPNNGGPVDGQFTGFRIRILAGNSDSCTMYEEIQTKDLRNTSGSFAITIGDGSVIGNYNVTGISFFDELFKNDRTFNFIAPAGCAAAPYTAGIKDNRKLYVEFREGPASPWEAMPIMALNYVPFAHNAMTASTADKVGLHGSSSLLRVENTGVPSAATALTPANFTEFLALLNGSTSQYLKSATGTAGQVTVSNSSGALTLGLADVSGLTPGTYGSSSAVPVLTVDSKGRVTVATTAAISGGAPTGTAGGDLSGTYPNPAIATSAVTTAKIADSNVTNAKIADNAVTTTKILNDNVTNAKIADDAVTTAKIADGTITGSDISGTAALSVASVTATGNVGSVSVSTRGIAISPQSGAATGPLQFLELATNGTNSVGFKAPDDITASLLWTLPAADGAPSQVLTTNGSGVLSWTTPATGSGDALTTNPLSQFAATTSAQLSGVLSDETGTGAAVFGTSPTFTTQLTSPMIVGGTGTTSPLIYRSTTGVGTTGADHIFQVGNNGGTEAMRILNNGNVGIGTSNPGSGRLRVVTSSTEAAYLESNSSANVAVLNVLAPNLDPFGSSNSLVLGRARSNGESVIISYRNNTTAATRRLAFHMWGGSDIMTLMGNMNVGIGETTPTARLHLPAGTIAAGTAPLKLTQGVNMTTAEVGAIEFDGTNLFFTDNTATRRTISTAGSSITALTGDVTASGSGSVTATIANDAVTYAKMQNVSATNRLLGRATAGAGDVEEITIGSGLALTGTTLSASGTDSFAALPCSTAHVPFHNGTSWTCVEALSTNTNNAIVRRNGTGGFTAQSGVFNGSVAVTDGAVGGQVTIAAPGTFTSYNLTLPTTDGDASQVLTTNGSGVLSWTTPPTGTGDALVSNPLSQFASTTSSQLAGVISDETGTGAAVFGTSPTFTTQLTSPMIVGGSSTTSALTYKTTSGVGTTGADHIFQVGNDGGTEAMRILNNGNVGIGTTNPGLSLQVSAPAGLPATSGTTQTGIFRARNSAGGGVLDQGQITSGGSWFQATNATNLSLTYNILLNPNGGNVGIGLTDPTGALHLKAGTTAAGTAPLKLTQGVNMTTAEVGAIEFDGTNLFFTDNTNTRRTLINSGTTTVGDFKADGTVPMTAQLRGVATNATSFSFNGNTNTGFGQVATNEVSASTNGSVRMRISSAGDIGLGGTVTSAAGAGASMYIQGTGNVGIGRTPSSRLEVQGAIRSVSSTGGSAANASAAVDWSLSNSQSMSVACTTTTFTNMLDGATYNLLVTDTTASTCTFSQAGLTFLYAPANGSRVSGLNTIYSFTRIGSSVVVSWSVLNP